MECVGTGAVATVACNHQHRRSARIAGAVDRRVALPQARLRPVRRGGLRALAGKIRTGSSSPARWCSQTCVPCDPSSLTRWRQRLGEAGMEALLAHTINTAHAMKAVDARELSRVIVDTTVQEKAIAHPTDSRLLEVARKKLVLLAKRHGIVLWQTLCEARSGVAPQGWALCACAPVQAHAQGTATPTHDPGTRMTRSATQAGPAGTVGT